MKQIPPRGTPEFEEYKKTVEEAHRNGARIEIMGQWQRDWMPIDNPRFNFWHDTLYRIAADQPESFKGDWKCIKPEQQDVPDPFFTGNQAPEPPMTATEQRIVKALDQIMYALAEVYRFAEAVIDAKDAKIERLLFHADNASKLVTALVADLPLPSPSPAPSGATAPQREARNGQHETSETGAVRSSVYPQGAQFPIRLDLLFRNSAGLRRLAETWGEGEAKYGPDNWMKGHKESCYISHALEHIRLYLAGDKSEDHLAHGAWNLLALCWVEENKPELLDLTKPNQNP